MPEKQQSNSIDNNPENNDAVKVESSAKPSTKEKPQANVKPSKTIKFGLLPIFSVLLLTILSLGAASGYYLWHLVDSSKSSLDQTISNNQNNISNLSNALKQSKSSVNNKIKNLTELQNNLSNSVQVFLAQSSHLRKDWLISEAEFLVKLANHRLNLEADVNTAITAIQNADARLNEAGDPGLLLLRQELSNNLIALKAVPTIDITGISFQISSVIAQIEQLPLLTPDPKSYALQERPAETEFNSWQDVFANVTRELMGLIRFREHQNPVQPLIAPEQGFYLSQNLKLQLEQARTALLHNKEKAFHERITQSLAWIKDYFDTSNSATASAISILASFDNKIINPELPDISYALQMFKDFQAGLKLKVKPEEPPVKSEATEIPKQTQQNNTDIQQLAPLKNRAPSQENKPKIKLTTDKGVSI